METSSPQCCAKTDGTVLSYALILGLTWTYTCKNKLSISDSLVLVCFKSTATSFESEQVFNSSKSARDNQVLKVKLTI